MFNSLEKKFGNIYAFLVLIILFVGGVSTFVIRYTEEGIVKIQGSFDKEKVYISVSDTGRGIPREYLNKVFEKFVRIEGFEIP